MNSGSNEWSAPPPLVQQAREPFLRSFLKAISRSPKADIRSQALSRIPTPSEYSLFSSCTGNHSSDSEEDLIYENVKNIENLSGRGSGSEDSVEALDNSFLDIRRNFLEPNQSSRAPACTEMEDQVNLLRQAVERM